MIARVCYRGHAVHGKSGFRSYGPLRLERGDKRNCVIMYTGKNTSVVN